MLDDHDGIPLVGQVTEDAGQGRGIPRVESDRRLIQHIQSSHQARAELVGQGNPLGLPAGEGFRLPRQCQVAQSHPQQKTQLSLQLAEDIFCDLRIEGR